MTTEQQRKMLEAAAKACGFECEIEQFSNGRCCGTNQYNEIVFDPCASAIDTAEMCAKLEIDTVWAEEHVVCHVGSEMLYEAIELYEDHDNYHLKAWMHAATMVAAKIGGMK